MEVVRAFRKLGWKYYELGATIKSDALQGNFDLWYRVPLTYSRFLAPSSGNPFLAALLLPAMRLGEALRIPLPCSELLLQNIEKIQNLYISWDSGLLKVKVDADPRPKQHGMQNKCSQTGLFFSLGVDSYYSFFQNVKDIHCLLLVHGFDILYEGHNHNLFPLVYRNVKMVARQFNKKVLTVATNIHNLGDHFSLEWARLYHGAAMASVGLLFETLFSKIYIASTYSWDQLHPHGSHPDLDPLWSTETLTFVHHGCETRRLDKILFIARFPVVLETLRVCWRNLNGAYNCGSCEKCLRTMIGLHIAGVLHKCKTLPAQIDLQALQKISVETTGDFLSELIDALGSSKYDVAIKRILIEIRDKERGKK